MSTAKEVEQEIEQEIDENDLLSDAPNEFSLASERALASPFYLMYSLMKQMQENMNNMASSLKTLS